jgi:hypothetical protein
MIGHSPQRSLAGPGWFAQVKAAVKRDPKRSGLLAILVTVMFALWGRMIIGNHGPAGASAAGVEAAVVNNLQSAAGQAGQGPPKLPLSDWARQTVGQINRNLFSVPFDYYPEDPAHPPKRTQMDNNQAKSADSQADQIKERQILVQNLQTEAADLTLEGTVLGTNPRAWINGVLVGIKQPIGKTGFVVSRIESRRIFIEKEGVQIELLMK